MPLYSSEVLPAQPQRLLPTSNSAVFWGGSWSSCTTERRPVKGFYHICLPKRNRSSTGLAACPAS